ncbi:hypothetical protein IFM89_004556 [Coptis chinensis]|uniref:tRNA pseudouridine synthase n=1 Tax=Coptis chinensis TaxID=261450 RepID=A0A835LGE3_9MAGN|nr:hypothetical protein IFM89_004556 [Coptis chinensis]
MHAKRCNDSLNIQQVDNNNNSNKPVKISKTKEEEEEEERGMQRYLFAVEYIGTRFSGSQKQTSNYRTVVGVLEEAFHKFIGRPVTVSCSSRTDAGVHALCNVCHVDIERISKRKPGEVLPAHEPEVVRKAVNHFLLKNEGDVMVTDVRCVPSDFHARFKAQERTYFYRLLSGPEPLSTFEKDRAWHVPEDLDFLAMQKACRVLIGCHDFSSFRAAGCQANSPIRTLDELNVSEVVSVPYFPSFTERGQAISSEQDQPKFSYSYVTEGLRTSGGNEFGQRKRHRCFVITARARSFLYHQVRLLVGVLKCVGTGDLTTNDVEGILNAKTITAASPMAPACGLYLGNVKYELP